MRTLFFALPVVVLLMLLAACAQTASDDDDDVADDTVGLAAVDDGDDAATPEPEEADPTVTSEPDPTEPPTADDATDDATDDAVDDAADDVVDDVADDAADSDPVEHVIELQDPDRFDPADLDIGVGDTIRFVNAGNINHTATLDPEVARDSDNALLPDGAETWDSGSMEPGDEFSITLDVPGEYVYFCRPHEVLGMVGAITVNGDGADSDDDDTDDDHSDPGETDDDDEDGVDDYL